MATETLKFISYAGFGDGDARLYSNGGTGVAANSYDCESVIVFGDQQQYTVEIAEELNGNWILSLGEGEHTYLVTLSNTQVTIDLNAQAETKTQADDRQSHLVGLISTLEVTRSVYLQAVFDTLNLVRGDRHDGLEAPKLTWETDKTYNAKAVQLLIYGDDGILAQGSGTADGNTITIDDIELEFAENLFRGNPLQAKLSYALIAGTKETLRFGKCLIKYRPDID